MEGGKKKEKLSGSELKMTKNVSVLPPKEVPPMLLLHEQKSNCLKVEEEEDLRGKGS